jgi:hypothetical protein
MDGIDLPLTVLGILEDGRVVFTGEDYRRSYLIYPDRPERDFEHPWPISWSWTDHFWPNHWWCSHDQSEWIWPNQMEKELEKPSNNLFSGAPASSNKYWVRIAEGDKWFFGASGGDEPVMQEMPLIHCAENLDEGSVVFFNMEDIDYLEDYVELEDDQKKLIRWLSDVSIIGAAKVRPNEVIVVKRSGPVTIRKGLRQ